MARRGNAKRRSQWFGTTFQSEGITAGTTKHILQAPEAFSDFSLEPTIIRVIGQLVCTIGPENPSSETPETQLIHLWTGIRVEHEDMPTSSGTVRDEVYDEAWMWYGYMRAGWRVNRTPIYNTGNDTIQYSTGASFTEYWPQVVDTRAKRKIRQDFQLVLRTESNEEVTTHDPTAFLSGWLRWLVLE